MRQPLTLSRRQMALGLGALASPALTLRMAQAAEDAPSDQQVAVRGQPKRAAAKGLRVWHPHRWSIPRLAARGV